MTLTKHYRLIAILLFCASLLALACSAIFGLLMGVFACDNPPNGDVTICLVFGGGAILIGSLLLALSPLWAAVGLFKRNLKSRRLALICAGVLCVMFIPIGTIAGSYMLYVMLKLDSEKKYFA